MTKHAAMTVLGGLVVVVAVGGFPETIETILLVLGGVAIAVLAYLSSVVYCSNCSKLIEEAEQALPTSTGDIQNDPINITKKIQ